MLWTLKSGIFTVNTAVLMIWLDKLWRTEVLNFNRLIFIVVDDILWLDTPVSDLLIMEILQAFQDLFGYLLDSSFVGLLVV